MGHGGDGMVSIKFFYRVYTVHDPHRDACRPLRSEARFRMERWLVVFIYSAHATAKVSLGHGPRAYHYGRGRERNASLRQWYSCPLVSSPRVLASHWLYLERRVCG